MFRARFRSHYLAVHRRSEQKLCHTHCLAFIPKVLRSRRALGFGIELPDTLNRFCFGGPLSRDGVQHGLPQVRCRCPGARLAAIGRSSARLRRWGLEGRVREALLLRVAAVQRLTSRREISEFLWCTWCSGHRSMLGSRAGREFKVRAAGVCRVKCGDARTATRWSTPCCAQWCRVRRRLATRYRRSCA